MKFLGSNKQCYFVVLIFCFIAISLYSLQAVTKLRKRVTKMVLSVSVIYGLCWLPHLTIYTLNYFSSSFNYSDITHISAIVVVASNSSVNPFIYVFVNKRFRSKIKTLLRCHCSSRRFNVTARVWFLAKRGGPKALGAWGLREDRLGRSNLDLVNHYVPSRSLRSISQGLLTVPRTTTSTYGNRAFSIAAPRLWNTLPLMIRNAQFVSLPLKGF